MGTMVFMAKDRSLVDSSYRGKLILFLPPGTELVRGPVLFVSWETGGFQRLYVMRFIREQTEIGDRRSPWDIFYLSGCLRSCPSLFHGGDRANTPHKMGTDVVGVRVCAGA